jgi:CheY-like chemotaxis protein
MDSRNATILYVEDEADDVFFMRMAFRKTQLSPRLEVVEDGQRAIAYLAGEGPFSDRTRHPVPSLVLLDLNLPVYSGFEVLAWLRSRAEFKQLSVVVFSSSGRPEDRARAQQLGASGYLLKPASGLDFTQVAGLLSEGWLERAPADAVRRSAQEQAS